jgi:hypothetical protein
VDRKVHAAFFGVWKIAGWIKGNRELVRNGCGSKAVSRPN